MKKKHIKNFISVKYKVMLQVLVPISIIFLILYILDYYEKKQELLDHYNIFQEQSENNIINSIKLMNKSSQMIEAFLKEPVKKDVEKFLVEYLNVDNDPEKLNFEKLKKKFNNDIDFSIISRDGIIEYSSKKENIGFDLKINTDFFYKLTRIRMGTEPVYDNFNLDLETKKVIQSVYIPINTHKYLLKLEIASYLIMNSINEQDIIKISNQLKSYNPLLKEVIIYNSDGKTINNSYNISSIVTKVKSAGKYEIRNDYNTLTRYIYIDLLEDNLKPTDPSKIVALTYDLNFLNSELNNTILASVIYSIVSILILMILLFFISGRITKPVLELNETVKYFSNNDFSHRADISHKDEMGELALEINHMAETIQIHTFNLEQLIKQRTRELETERNKSEKLLLNILPESIAKRLKDRNEVIADNFNEASVLFADLVGFTKISAMISPQKIIDFLNKLFKKFDELVDKYGLEKIKTIGDSYMTAGGVPIPDRNHLEATANFALDMMNVINTINNKNKTNLRLRIGIHVGPLVAGVIGTKKFTYDLWGDTVNTASRMESHSIPGKIQVSNFVFDKLKDKFTFEERESLIIKGKGKMKTYFLTGKK